MAFESKWDKLPQEKQDEIKRRAVETSPYRAASEYADEIKMNQVYLTKRLTSFVAGYKRLYPKKEDKIAPTSNDSKYGKPSKKSEDAKSGEVELSPEEKLLVEKLRTGEVDLKQVSGIVAARAVEKMLKNPSDVKFIDFFRTELLKLKQQEVTDRNNFQEEMINRMFGGKLPPRECPHCGMVIAAKPLPTTELVKIEEGEEVGLVSSTRNI